MEPNANISMKYIEGDIHDVIKTIPDDSIDLIYTSPPYAITNAEWDQPLKWDEMFPEIWRVLKKDGVCVLHASMPFSYELIKHSNPFPKYNYIWKKDNSTGFFSAKYQPLREHEEVFVYYKKAGTYNPQMIGDTFHKKRFVNHGNQNYFNSQIRTKEEIYDTEEGGHSGRYPKTILEYPVRKCKTKGGITRCDEMMDFFIKTYSNEGDTVMDLTTHNEIVGSRVTKLNRNFIGCDIHFNFMDGENKPDPSCISVL